MKKYDMSLFEFCESQNGNFLSKEAVLGIALDGSRGMKGNGNWSTI